MECFNHLRRLPINFLCSSFPTLRLPLRKNFTCRSFLRQRVQEFPELFAYTSGRWIFNNELRQSERKRVFNVPELKRLAAASIGQKEEDVAGFEKLAEGGFNRTFRISMRDGFQFVARIPYPVTEPKHLLVASEVATMDFLRNNGIPVPKVYGYSPVSTNTAGTEYIFMELVRGTNLSDIWFDLSESDRIKIITEIVELEARLFDIGFPASGSLYYTDDLQPEVDKPIVLSTHSSGKDSFCIGPDLTPGLWYGKRLNLSVNRGPYRDCTAAITAGAKKEIAYLEKFGRPLQPFQRLRREIYNYQPQSHLEHIANLNKYLQVAPYLVPENEPALTRPTIRHPDLQPSNIFVSDELEITGLIDWQGCTVLPLFLQCGIPNSIQNYGDDVSESLKFPVLPDNFNELEEKERLEQLELLRRRQLHYFYFALTSKINPLHYNALSADLSILRRKAFHHASEPWEGDNVTLKADLVHVAKSWSRFVNSAPSKTGDAMLPCPIAYSEEEISECLRLDAAKTEADEHLQSCCDAIGGIGPEGWVPPDIYDEVKQREQKLKNMFIELAESGEEKLRLEENWIFDDFDEEEYM
ncbi:kinase-like protein [Xylona heveae TC161]|uniref:Kinase-like protein n=1 Tax=Xylona heveae (strain CBS 132557 / TC161) TaxID=1328760 RepID=A0A161TBI5_XYLHT|nr:kinase-like protein [Xylona heveae TC161]KZF23037.1 kinase-like protein [Xylona heveae TC161]